MATLQRFKFHLSTLIFAAIFAGGLIRLAVLPYETGDPLADYQSEGYYGRGWPFQFQGGYPHVPLHADFQIALLLMDIGVIILATVAIAFVHDRFLQKRSSLAAHSFAIFALTGLLLSPFAERWFVFLFLIPIAIWVHWPEVKNQK